ncbi:alpha/beta hydrolase [Halobacteriales archaeon QS_1_68_20]|nr:MAG: alpha/beta hydrolase [Halobacteriales archaeon QS_1_68_20]
MPVEDVTLDVDHGRSPGRLNAPADPTDSGILVLPGAGHGPFEDVFDRFAEAAADAGHTVARFETWSDHDERDEKTPDEFAAEIEGGAEFLRERGCETLTVVAKSFGGRLALEHATGVADRMVLWAPAVLFGDHDEAPSITADELAGIEFPVGVLQGDEDEVVPPENSAEIAEHLPRGELVELPGEGHSFLNDQGRIVEETLAFLPE